MASVTKITQYLYQNNPQSSLGRLTYYHFLKNTCDFDQEVDLELTQSFIYQCLQFDYWRQNCAVLEQSLLSTLEELREHRLLPFVVEQLQLPESIQVVGLKSQETLCEIIRRYSQKESPLLQHRVKPIENNQAMLITLLSSGGIRVQVFSGFVRINNAELTPLPALSDLEYTSSLELLPEHSQRVQLDGLSTQNFLFDGEGFLGKSLHGNHFQVGGSLDSRGIVPPKELFFALKRLEKYFVDHTTDPFYRELVDQLEKVHKLLLAGNKDVYPTAMEILKRGRAALNNIFQNDQLLLLLVNNIEYTLRTGDKTPQNSEGAQTQWRSPKPLPL